jgi:hypothetical protein
MKQIITIILGTKITRIEARNIPTNRDESDRKRLIGDQITFIFTFFSKTKLIQYYWK